MSNSYEEQQAARKERYEALADQAKAQSNAKCSSAHEMAQLIPVGQPILVGHYSEGRDRRYRERMSKKFQDAVDLQKKADYYEAKANGVGRGGISSDDPEAVAKLNDQLESAKKSQELMKSVNKAIRAAKTDEQRIAAIVALGISEKSAEELIKPDYSGRVGFPNYSLTNNNANIRRLEKRISELKAKQTRTDVEEVGKGYVYREDVTENRVMFIFEGKPVEEVRATLKRYAFKWSPSRDAWVRKMTGNALWDAKEVRQKLDDLA